MRTPQKAKQKDVVSLDSDDLPKMMTRLCPFEINYLGQSASVWDIIPISSVRFIWVIHYNNQILQSPSGFGVKVKAEVTGKPRSLDGYTCVNYQGADKKKHRLDELFPIFEQKLRSLTTNSKIYPIPLPTAPIPETVSQFINEKRAHSRYFYFAADLIADTFLAPHHKTKRSANKKRARRKKLSKL